MASSFSKARGNVFPTAGGRRRGGRASEPANKVRSGTALRDANGNLVAGEFNAATKTPLGYSDPNPSKIRTPSSDPRTSAFSQADQIANFNAGQMRSNMPDEQLGSRLGSRVASRLAGTAMERAPSRLGTPMPGIPESRNPMSDPAAPGQSISRSQIAFNQARRNGGPNGKTLTAEQAVTAFGGSSRPTALTMNPNGTRSITGQYGSGSTRLDPMVAKAPAAGRSKSAFTATSMPISPSSVQSNDMADTKEEKKKKRTNA